MNRRYYDSDCCRFVIRALVSVLHTWDLFGCSTPVYCTVVYKLVESPDLSGVFWKFLKTKRNKRKRGRRKKKRRLSSMLQIVVFSVILSNKWSSSLGLRCGEINVLRARFWFFQVKRIRTRFLISVLGIIFLSAGGTADGVSSTILTLLCEWYCTRSSSTELPTYPVR